MQDSHYARLETYVSLSRASSAHAYASRPINPVTALSISVESNKGAMAYINIPWTISMVAPIYIFS